MKGILAFKLPQEDEEFRMAVNGFRYRNIVDDMNGYLREKIKYGHKYKNATEAVEDIRRYLWECIEEYKVEVL